MRTLLPLVAAVFTAASTTALADTRIERVLVAADRAVIHGQTDAAHDLVL